MWKLRPFEDLVGFLIAFFLLVGRWTPARLTGEMTRADARVAGLHEPRVWAILALLLLTIPVLAMQHVRRREIPRLRLSEIRAPAILSILLLGYMLLTLMWTPDPTLAKDKASDIASQIAVLIGLVVALQVAEPDALRTGFWKSALLMTTVMAGLAVLSMTASRLAVLGGGPNVFARNMSFMLLGAIYFLRRGADRSAWLWIPILVVAALLIVASGSRAAMVGAVFALGVLLVLERAHLQKKVLFVGGATIVGAAILSFSEFGVAVKEVFTDRVIDDSIGQHNLADRDILADSALKLGTENPIFGAGLEASHSAAGQNAHNLLLEIFCEGGCVGLLLCVGVLMSFCMSLWKIRRRMDPSTVAAVVFHVSFCLLNTGLALSGAIFVLLLLALIPVPGTERNIAPVPTETRGAAMGDGLNRPPPVPHWH